MKFAGFENEPKSVGLVWALNLVPALGLGLLYAAGPKSIALLSIVWVYEFVAICTKARFADQLHVVIQTYVFLSILGSVYACIHNLKLATRKQNANFHADARQRSPEYEELRNIVNHPDNRLDLKALDDYDGEVEVQPLDSFKRKAEQAEEFLKRNRKEAIPKSVHVQEELSFAPPSTREPIIQSHDYSTNQQFFPIQEENFAKEGDGSEPLSVEEWLKEPLDVVESADDVPSEQGQTADAEYQFPTDVVVPLVPSNPRSETQVESSDFVNLLREAPANSLEVAQPIHDVSFDSDNNSAPYPSSQSVEESIQSLEPAPDFVVADQLSEPVPLVPNCAPVVPQLETVPGSSEQVQEFIGKLGDTVGTSYQQEPVSKPSFDLSFPNFEAPKFSFDFSSALSSDLSSAVSSTEKTDSKPRASKEHCPRCGSAKQSDFSFCLKCGISF